MKHRQTVAFADIPGWGTFKVYADSVEMTCTLKFVNKMRLAVEKTYRKRWKDITPEQLGLMSTKLMSMFCSRLIAKMPGTGFWWDEIAGMMINGSNCRPDFDPKPSYIRYFMLKRRMAFTRHSGGWKQHSWRDVQECQEAWREKDKASIAFAVARAVIVGKQSFAEDMANILFDVEKLGLQPMDIWNFTCQDGIVSAYTIFGEKIPLFASSKIADGRVFWKKFSYTQRLSANRKLRTIF